MKKRKNDNSLQIAFSIIAIFTVIFLAIANDYSIPTGMAAADLKSLEYALNNLDEVKSLYNEKLSAVPNFVRTLFGNEKMNVSIIKTDGLIEIISVETVEGRIEVISHESFESYTMNVNLQEKVINEIISAEDSVLRLKEALDNEELTYEALNIGTGIKLGISRFLLGLMILF